MRPAAPRGEGGDEAEAGQRQCSRFRNKSGAGESARIGDDAECADLVGFDDDLAGNGDAAAAAGAAQCGRIRRVESNADPPGGSTRAPNTSPSMSMASKPASNPLIPKNAPEDANSSAGSPAASIVVHEYVNVNGITSVGPMRLSMV